MSDNRVERHRDEGVYVPKIQEEKKQKEKFSDLPPDEEKKILYATFFNYLKNLFDKFAPSKKLAGKTTDIQGIIRNLNVFKSLLLKLKKEDLSQSADYASKLSDIWILLMEDFETIALIERKELKKVAKFRDLMDMVKNFPPDSEHRFGYYLLEHAGKDWLPFPFIEILAQLHNKPETLIEWQSLIDQVIESLKGKPVF